MTDDAILPLRPELEDIAMQLFEGSDGVVSFRNEGIDSVAL